ncbi:MAG: hypothetical protein ACRDKT_01010 [Actinomycetota bacterium]
MSVRARAVVALCLVGLVGACRDARVASTAPRPTPSEPVVVNGGECVPTIDQDLPRNAGCVTSIETGDEKLSVYAILDRQSRPRSWRIHHDSNVRTVDQRLNAGNDFSYPRAVGTSDVDLDGDQEWWIKTADYTSHGAPWSGLNLFVSEGRSLVPLHFEGQPLMINFGGITRLGEGAVCRDGDLVLRRAEAQNTLNTRWSISTRRFSLNESTARLVDRGRSKLVIEDYNDPKLDPYYEVECYGATFTVFQR